MYVSTDQPQADHAHVTLEHGPRAGTWEVRHERGALWRVRSPEGRERVLNATEPWIGDLGTELVELLRRIAPRAVEEAIHRDRIESDKAEEDPPDEQRYFVTAAA